MIMVRDSGWIQMIAENCQEIMDLTIQGFRIAEDYDIQLPIMINYDGYYLSFLAESVEIPGIEEVDDYLSILKKQPQRMTLVPGKSLGCGSHGMELGFVEARKKHMDALERVKNKVDEIDAEFGKAFGRTYGGQIDTYRTEDADIIFLTSGSAVGTARDVVDAKREQGIKVGLVKLRLFRPFPIETLAPVLRGRKAIGVLDRAVGFGWGCGPIFMEVKALVPNIGEIVPMLSFIDGLANMDITNDHIATMIDKIYSASQGNSYEELTWLP
jgi:pyruvate/2-oxoacid:ferredoxin oxidoreductase alpha subunit